MRLFPRPYQEIPPTAGLPLLWRDLLPGKRKNFTTELARQLAIPSPLLTCSGTAALILAIKTLQQHFPARTEIIVPAYTCPLVALAAYHCSNIKVLPCDLLPNSIDLDPEHLTTLCSEQTLAVVVTHLAGRIADVAIAKKIATTVGANVIEDAAQALGAKIAGQSVGLQGEFAFFSLAVGKGLTSFEGGVLFSRDPALLATATDIAQQFLPYHRVWEWRRIIELMGYTLFYHPKRLALVYGDPLRRALQRQDEITAVGDDFSVDDIPLHNLGHYRQQVACAALPRLHNFLLDNRQRALQRIQRLCTLPGITVLYDQQRDQEGVWPFILLLLPSKQLRDLLLSRLWHTGVGVTRLFIHTLPDYPNVKNFLVETGPLHNAHQFADRSFSISNSHWLDDATFNWICTQIETVSGTKPA